MTNDERSMRRSRDPLAWLMIADLLDERGETIEAKRWRLRGDLADQLLPIFRELAYYVQPMRREITLRNGLGLKVIRKTKTIRVHYGLRKFIVMQSPCMGLGPPLNPKLYSAVATRDWQHLRTKIYAIAEWIMEYSVYAIREVAS